MPIFKLKKQLIFIIALGIFSSVSAQGNLPYVDQKPFHFGFSLGFNAMDFGITPSLSSVDGKTYQADVSSLSTGFSVGMISDLRLSRYLNLRVTPCLHFGSRKLNYNFKTGITDSVSIPSLPICLPVSLKYSAERVGNYRPYLTWGLGVYFDLGRNKESPVLLKPLDVYTEFGVGCDLYFSFFKLSPELKFAVGFNNMFTPLDSRDAVYVKDADRKYSLALSKLTSRLLTLTFNFE